MDERSEELRSERQVEKNHLGLVHQTIDLKFIPLYRINIVTSANCLSKYWDVMPKKYIVVLLWQLGKCVHCLCSLDLMYFWSFW